MMLAERVQPALSTMKVTSDEEIIVDRMIAASQRKGEVALPSFGRDLVPYFVPGTEMWNENDVNVNTDVDSFRREGASLLDIPVPTFREASGKGVKAVALSVNVRREMKTKSRSRNKRKEDTGIVDLQTSLKPLKVGHGDRTTSAVSPTSPFGISTSTSSSECDVSEQESSQNVSGINYGQRPLPQSLSSSAPGAWSFSASMASVNVTGTQRMPPSNAFTTPPSSPELRRLNCANSALLRTSVNEKWAGPAYANSPPPSCLPLPTFACKKATGSTLSHMAISSKMNESAGCSAIVQSAPVSPAQSTISAPAAVLSVDAFFGKRVQARQSGISNALGLPRRLLDMDVEVSVSSDRCSLAEVNEATNSLKKILQII